MTNSFWREVIDHLPGFHLLFRVDENEDAHLIFVNSQIQDLLGYTPEEFVLASESADAIVHKEIVELVESVAKQSHDEYPEAKPICRFHSKRAAEYSFSFEFRIFSVKSSPLPFIAVSLQPIVSGKKSGSGKVMDKQPETEQEIFVAESNLMQALMRKVDAISDQKMHVLFRGDKGTGKRTLARQVMRSEALSGAQCKEWNLPEMTGSEQDEAVDAMISNGGGDSGTNSKDRRLSLLIIEIGSLSRSNQNKLLDWLNERMSEGKQTRILATSRTLLEEQMKRSKFSAELYYHLGFDSILLPPLSQRKEDIKLLVMKWVPRAAKALGLGKMEITDQVMERLLQHGWQGNFHEFYRTLRRSLLQSEQGILRLSLDPVASGEPSGTDEAVGIIGGNEIVAFDEMSSRYLEMVLRKTEGKIYGRDGAAYLLGMKPTTLQSKLKKLGVR